MPARLQVVLAAICFGTTGTAQALGPAASPVAVGAARIVLGGALLVAIARAAGIRIPRIDRTVLVIAVGVCVYQLSFFAAVKLTGVAVGTVVAIGSGPAAAGLLGRLVNGERFLDGTSCFGETQGLDFACVLQRSGGRYWVRSGLTPSSAKALA